MPVFKTGANYNAEQVFAALTAQHNDLRLPRDFFLPKIDTTDSIYIFRFTQLDNRLILWLCSCHVRVTNS
jgi:hypothetical protein